MEQNYAAVSVPQVSVIPDREERTQIRRRYNKAALVIFMNMMIFNILGIGGSLMLYALGYGSLFDNEVFNALFSCGIPVISEVTSIIIGVKMFGLNFKPMLTREGYDGGTMTKLLLLTLGLQTAASYLASLIGAILEMFGLKGATADLSPTTSLPANLIMYFYACLLGPVLEELLYRGVLLQSLRKYNERFAIFFSSAIFGLMHQNYQQFILGFIVGIPLATVTIKHGSLLPSIFAHIIMNTSGIVFSCWIQYASPELYSAALSGESGDLSLSSLTTGGMAAILCSAGFRIAVLIAGLVVGIIVLVKGKNMSRPTPAGKARTMPVFVTAALWWIVLALYMFLNFVYPFITV